MKCICDSCKNNEKPLSYAGIQGLPVLKSSVEASGGTMLDDLEQMSAKLKSPEYRGEACVQCHTPFGLDDVRWHYQTYILSTEDILNRVVHKGEYVRAVSLRKEREEVE